MSEELVALLEALRAGHIRASKSNFNRLRRYFEAVDTGSTDRYWDYRDVLARRMSREDYNRKWKAHLRLNRDRAQGNE